MTPPSTRMLMGSINADNYVEDIVVKWNSMEPNALFTQDNARSHMARQVIDYFGVVDIPLKYGHITVLI